MDILDKIISKLKLYGVNFDSKLSFKNHVDLNIYLKIKILPHTCSLGDIWIIDIVLVVFIYNRLVKYFYQKFDQNPIIYIFAQSFHNCFVITLAYSRIVTYNKDDRHYAGLRIYVPYPSSAALFNPRFLRAQHVACQRNKLGAFRRLTREAVYCVARSFFQNNKMHKSSCVGPSVRFSGDDDDQLIAFVKSGFQKHIKKRSHMGGSWKNFEQDRIIIAYLFIKTTSFFPHFSVVAMKPVPYNPYK
ncbi:Transcription factor Adf-1 [Aphis craccivora]|uniref:Transcription factor Adf-1 n=1 Tax=Aphis craccivora TaxID=307492 RepID=A0A6G0Y3Q9_APHCR|nr:Transcription factor Adf-1 [Aphis craccivora]